MVCALILATLQPVFYFSNPLAELEFTKTKALEILRDDSKFLTEPSPSPDENPQLSYHLQGVCTLPHVTYVRRRRASDSDSKADDGWQWWRISFSTDDAKRRQAERSTNESDRSDYVAPQNADVVGYTAHKVREIEVLRAARMESRTVLLVYANSRALSVPESPLPKPLQVCEFCRLLISL